MTEEGGRTGRTRDNMAKGDKVAFSVAAMGRLIPAPEALEFSVEYAGVVVFGRGRVVEDRQEAKAALQAQTTVYQIDIETWSGKQKEVEEDFPGAFDLPHFPVPFPSSSAAVGRKRSIRAG